MVHAQGDEGMNWGCGSGKKGKEKMAKRCRKRRVQ